MLLSIEQKSKIEKIYSKYFKGSAIDYTFFERSNYSRVTFYLAGNEKELAYGYWSNDCFNIIFNIALRNGVYTLTARVKDYKIEPPTRYYYCGRRVIPFRKVEGDFDKILAGLDKFLNRLHEQFVIDLDSGELHHNFRELAKSKVVR